jgi:hypothetical protein
MKNSKCRSVEIPLIYKNLITTHHIFLIKKLVNLTRKLPTHHDRRKKIGSDNREICEIVHSCTNQIAKCRTLSTKGAFCNSLRAASLLNLAGALANNF